MKRVILVVLLFCSANAYSFPKEFCMELYAGVRYNIWSVETYTPAEAKRMPWNYAKIQLSTISKTRDSNGYTNFMAVGHAHNLIGDQVAITANGYLYNGSYHFNINGSLVQYTQGRIGPYKVWPVYEINVVADIPKNSNTGIQYMFNNLTNIWLITPETTGSEHNDFTEGFVNRISCKNYNW